MPEFLNNAIFWIETEKIKPNPYQPRKEFDEHHLMDLADSIRQYGVLQPLVVTRRDVPKEDGGLDVEYELIAGERRLRASKLAGVARVPALIKSGSENPQLKLELAIIENLQREDLNPVDRALAFARLVNEFSFKHTEVAKKVGKSREYVSNSLRLLVLPQEILDALSGGRITEGHARPLMMLSDKSEEQQTLFKEILFKKLTVREAEQVARHVAKDRVRKKFDLDPQMIEFERALAERLGTRVSIERRQVGGKVVIEFYSSDDLGTLLDRVSVGESVQTMRGLASAIADQARGATVPQTNISDQLEALADATPLVMDEASQSMVAESEPIPVPQYAGESYAAPIEEYPTPQFSGAELSEESPIAVLADAIERGDVELAAPYDDRSRDDEGLVLESGSAALVMDQGPEQREDEDLYAVRNFTI